MRDISVDISSERALLGGVLARGHALNFFERLDEVRGVFKATAAADRLHGVAAFQQKAGAGDTHAVQVVHIGHAGLGFETTAKMVFAVAGHGGDFLYRDLAGTVLIRPTDELLQT